MFVLWDVENCKVYSKTDVNYYNTENQINDRVNKKKRTSDLTFLLLALEASAGVEPAVLSGILGLACVQSDQQNSNINHSYL